MSAVIKPAELALEQLEELREAGAADTLETAREHLRRAYELAERQAPPVPVSLAAAKLGVSRPTVRVWIEAGVLEDAGKKPQAVTASSLAQVLAELRQLRASVRKARVLPYLIHRLQDRVTLGDPAVQRSLQQMRSGKKHYVHKRA